MKAESAGVPAPAPQPAPLPEDWAEQRGLLPVGPQGNITATRLPGGNCSLRVDNKPGVIVPLNSIAIPDTTRAVFIDQQCNVQPLVTIPVQSNATSSVGPGAIKLPVPPPNSGVQPAGGPAFLLLALTPETTTLLSGALVGLGIGVYNSWLMLGGMAVLTGDEAQQGFINKQSSGQSDIEIGGRAISIEGEVSSPPGPPEGPEEWPTNNWRKNGEDEELPRKYTFRRGQLQHAYDKHGKDWGLSSPQNSRNLAIFREKITQHMNSPTTQIVKGYYKGDRMIAFVNPRTGLHVGFKPNGEFWTSFELGPNQLRGLLEYGKFSQNKLISPHTVASRQGPQFI